MRYFRNKKYYRYHEKKKKKVFLLLVVASNELERNRRGTMKKKEKEVFFCVSNELERNRSGRGTMKKKEKRKKKSFFGLNGSNKQESKIVCQKVNNEAVDIRKRRFLVSFSFALLSWEIN